MSKIHSIFLIISLVVAAIFYIASDNFIIAIILFIIGIALSLLIYAPKVIKYKKECVKYHENFHFINNFIVALSVKRTISGAFESTVASMSQEFIDLINNLENLNDFEKLQYLSSYFTFETYQLFLELITLWQEEGGDILKMSKFLLSETRFEEKYISETSSHATKTYFEIGTLWTISLAILVLLRFSLKNFYEKINNLPIFLGSLLVLGIFVYFSIYILINNGTKIELKGFKK